MLSTIYWKASMDWSDEIPADESCKAWQDETLPQRSVRGSPENEGEERWSMTTTHTFEFFVEEVRKTIIEKGVEDAYRYRLEIEDGKYHAEINKRERDILVLGEREDDYYACSFKVNFENRTVKLLARFEDGGCQITEIDNFHEAYKRAHKFYEKYCE